MQVFLVGGAVRDIALGVEPNDKDFVVVGSSPEEMLALGFKQVGHSFPVFLSAEGDEHALARTEKKVGKGYGGFEVNASPEVTLEEDLRRRDLTINAMAMDSNRTVFIDPFNGLKDLKNGTLRHVDESSFGEDPLRVLRLARFCARFSTFEVHPTTFKLCEQMVADGELEHLTPERVNLELSKALMENSPERFFIFLRMVGALKVVFPEIHALIGKTQPFKWHPEGDAFTHSMLVLKEMVKTTHDLRGSDDAFDDMILMLRFCALTHDLGKGLTPEEELPHHKMHEKRGVDVVRSMCERLRISNHIREHAMVVAEFHGHIHKITELRASTIVDMFDKMNHLRNRDVIAALTTTSMCDARGRGPFFEDVKYPQRGIAHRMFSELTSVRGANVLPKDVKLDVPTIKKLMRDAKIAAVKKVQATL